MVLAARLDRLEEAIGEIRSSNQRIATSLERLVALEVQHAETRAGLDRAFAAITANNGRLLSIERRVAMWDEIVTYGAETGARVSKLEAASTKWDAAYTAVVWVITVTVLAAATLVWVKSGGVV